MCKPHTKIHTTKALFICGIPNLVFRRQKMTHNIYNIVTVNNIIVTSGK
jgi:hypothetical protein